MEETTKEAKLVVCYVCGAGSHREDWQDGLPHACDSHSKTEVAAARARTAKAAAPAIKTEPAPATPAVQTAKP